MGSRRDELVQLRAMAVDDVMTIGALERAGVTSASAYRRCAPGGPWQLLLPGVLLLHSGPPTWRQRMRAALIYAGPESLLTGACVTQLLGLKRTDPHGVVRLLIPHALRRRATGFVRIERTRRLPEPTTVAGFSCAPVARAVLDHARSLRNATEVQAVLAEAIQRRFCSPTALVDELDEGSSRGAALVRRELPDLVGGARSVSEIRAKRLVRRSSLPRPEWNVKLYTENGEFVGNPDAWFDDVGLAWEIDSLEYHLDPENYDRTLRRNARYAAHGLPMLPTRPSRLTREPAAVIDELVAAYEAAARLPRPRLIVVHTAQGAPSQRPA